MGTLKSSPLGRGIFVANIILIAVGAVAAIALAEAELGVVCLIAAVQLTTEIRDERQRRRLTAY